MDLRDRFRGVFLGTALGDALGLPFEGSSPGPSLTAAVRVHLETAAPIGYSDDTEMTIGVAESLTARGRFDAEHMIRTLANGFDAGRGYGHGMRRVLGAIRDGATSWDEAARSVWPEGSFGNGAAVRVGPIACAFRDDPAAIAAESAQLSHAHPVGVEGAVVMANAIAAAIAGKDVLEASISASAALRDRLERARILEDEDPKVVARALGNGTTADTSVVTAIHWFARMRNAEAVARAIHTGGDTDTIAAMTGALVGADGGETAFPAAWIARLEDGPRGRSYLLSLADLLFEKFASGAGSP